MKERPILFSTPMVQAILEGRKTQTRRVINNDLIQDWDDNDPTYGPFYADEYGDYHKTVDRCPYGFPDDLLYVRETWNLWLNDEGSEGYTRLIQFKADGDTIVVPEEQHEWFDQKEERGYLGRPGIHLPKWASRIWLKVKDIRVERLQDISEEDAKAEGPPMVCKDGIPYLSHTNAFKCLWDRINFDRGYGVGKNPWVWVVEFERVENQSGK